MNSEGMISLIGIYTYDAESKIYVVEMEINEKPRSVDFSRFFQKDDSLPESEWQVPYDEQYLTSDGKTILGDFFTEDKDMIPGDTTRVAFFMFLTDLSLPLSTPYGEIDLSDVKPMPERLSNIISYNPID